MAKKKRNSALAAAASKKLAQIGQQPVTAEHVAHFLMHAEERGEAERVPMDGGGWGWSVVGPDGSRGVIPASPEILAALERFQVEGHPSHD